MYICTSKAFMLHPAELVRKLSIGIPFYNALGRIRFFLVMPVFSKEYSV